MKGEIVLDYKGETYRITIDRDNLPDSMFCEGGWELHTLYDGEWYISSANLKDALTLSDIFRFLAEIT